jgi:amidophosphoribosyltransferase
MRFFFFHFSSRFTVCGILGLLLHDTTVNAAPEICEGLSLLQHRGQDACGIITCGPRGRLYQCKANGMVRDVFTQDAILRLIGGMGIGHGEPQASHLCTSLGQRISFC